VVGVRSVGGRSSLCNRGVWKKKTQIRHSETQKKRTSKMAGGGSSNRARGGRTKKKPTPTKGKMGGGSGTITRPSAPTVSPREKTSLSREREEIGKRQRCLRQVEGVQGGQVFGGTTGGGGGGVNTREQSSEQEKFKTFRRGEVNAQLPEKEWEG